MISGAVPVHKQHAIICVYIITKYDGWLLVEANIYLFEIIIANDFPEQIYMVSSEHKICHIM